MGQPAKAAKLLPTRRLPSLVLFALVMVGRLRHTKTFFALGAALVTALGVIAGIIGTTPDDMTSSTPVDATSYWQQPLAAQGSPPRDWPSVEASLLPDDCGQCHADKLEQWHSSRHAQAFSPGLVGQLLTFGAQDTADCMRCHAPLAEQRVAFEAARQLGMAHLPERQGIASAGNSCGGCHVRNHRRFGPPQQGTAAVGPSSLPAPHGGVFRTAFFESSDFCSTCHQFPAAFAINGKPLENTHVEWQQSPQARQGATCQTCHMPDRQHLWRGIHDPAMVASGLTPRVTADGDGVRFELINSGVGHAFPTYVTPRVMMFAVALSSSGTPRTETLRSYTIARRVRFDGNNWIEISDTRLLPNQSAVLKLAWNDSDRIRTWLEVFPDDYYENEIYPSLLKNSPSGSEPTRLIAKAEADAVAAHFRLFETELHRP